MPMESPSGAYQLLRFFYTNKELAQRAGIQQSHMSKGNYQYPPPSTIRQVRKLSIGALKDMASLSTEADDEETRAFWLSAAALLRSKL